MIVDTVKTLMCGDEHFHAEPLDATTLPNFLNAPHAASSPAPKRVRRLADSPVTVEATFEVSDEQKRRLLPLTTLTFLIVYTEMVKRRLWDCGFSNGSGQRRLAARHLLQPATDGWNCVAGAVELANAWAFRGVDIPEEIPDNFEFSLTTRLRLAVCLSVSWKFQRAMHTHFPRLFPTEEPSLLGPHTHELAHLGYFFMTEPDQAHFGAWNEGNVEAVRGLYDEMNALEADLLVHAPVFSLLTTNPQVSSEDRAADMLARGVISDQCAMAVRSIVPLFIYCTTGAKEPASAGGLVCAGMLAVSVASNPRAMADYSPHFYAAEFSAEERRTAWSLLRSALYPDKIAEHAIQIGCYRELLWENRTFVTPENLRVALVMAAAVA